VDASSLTGQIERPVHALDGRWSPWPIWTHTVDAREGGSPVGGAAQCLTAQAIRTCGSPPRRIARLGARDAPNGDAIASQPSTRILPAGFAMRTDPAGRAAHALRSAPCAAAWAGEQGERQRQATLSLLLMTPPSSLSAPATPRRPPQQLHLLPAAAAYNWAARRSRIARQGGARLLRWRRPMMRGSAREGRRSGQQPRALGSENRPTRLSSVEVGLHGHSPAPLQREVGNAERGTGGRLRRQSTRTACPAAPSKSAPEPFARSSCTCPMRPPMQRAEISGAARYIFVSAGCGRGQRLHAQPRPRDTSALRPGWASEEARS